MRLRLTNSERAIRRSAGIPIWRFLPFAVALIVLISMSFDEQLFQQCIGGQIQGSSRGAGWARLFVSLYCSPIYVRDFSHHWLAIVAFLLGIALGVPQMFWIYRHKMYWNAVREKERAKRAEKASAKADD